MWQFCVFHFNQCIHTSPWPNLTYIYYYWTNCEGRQMRFCTAFLIYILYILFANSRRVLRFLIYILWYIQMDKTFSPNKKLFISRLLMVISVWCLKMMEVKERKTITLQFVGDDHFWLTVWSIVHARFERLSREQVIIKCWRRREREW